MSKHGIQKTCYTENSYQRAGALCAPADGANGIAIVSPTGVNREVVGGMDWNYEEVNGISQRGGPGGVGLDNIGLPVRVWVRVSQSDTGELHYSYVDDGSGLNDSTVDPGRHRHNVQAAV